MTLNRTNNRPSESSTIVEKSRLMTQENRQQARQRKQAMVMRWMQDIGDL